MVKFCCQDMKNNIYIVDLNVSFYDGDQNNKVIYYTSKFNEYGIPIFDGENGVTTSYISIDHCPWCGKKLPESKRDEWFDTLEKLGYDSPFEDKIPPEFNTSEWYNRSTGDG